MKAFSKIGHFQLEILELFLDYFEVILGSFSTKFLFLVKINLITLKCGYMQGYSYKQSSDFCSVLFCSILGSILESKRPSALWPIRVKYSAVWCWTQSKGFKSLKRIRKWWNIIFVVEREWTWIQNLDKIRAHSK